MPDLRVTGRLSGHRVRGGLAAGIALATALSIAPSAAAGAGAPAADRPSRPATAVVPLSADLDITRTTVDAAGQRQVQQETRRFFRDSRGRTRTEAGSRVTISDPASRATVILDHPTRAYQRLVGVQKGAPAPARPSASTGRQLSSQPQSLGTAVVEGVEADGSFYTVTIPADGVQPSLRKEVTVWHSTEAQLPVRVTSVEPSGAGYTQTYRNIRTGVEPAADLFEVPVDYRVADPASSTPENSIAGVNICDVLWTSPLVINSVGTFYASGLVEAYALSMYVPFPINATVPCWFSDDSALFEAPLHGDALYDLPFPLDPWGVFDTGAWVPYLPYVAFGYINFVVTPVLPFPHQTRRVTSEVILIVN